jgi:hypothetical protein
MKKYLFGLFAVVLAVAAVAFTNKPQKVRLEDRWYTYNPSLGQQNQVGSYEFFDVVSPECPDATTLCAIRVDGAINQNKLNALLATDDSNQDGIFDVEQPGTIEFQAAP